MVNQYQQKPKKKLQKKHAKDIKIFLKKKKKKDGTRLETDIKIFLKKKKTKKKHQYQRDRNKNLSKEDNQKKVEYMRNYYLKQFLSCFLVFYKVVRNGGYIGTKKYFNV